MARTAHASAKRPRLPRVELYRLLAEPARLQILALCAEEELSVGELADILRDSQPQISRKVAPLRDAELLSARKDGTRTWLKSVAVDGDEVLADALDEGRRLCRDDGSLARLPKIIAAREDLGREFFDAQPEDVSEGEPASPAMLAHLSAMAPVLPGHALAVDVGTGEGLLLDVLAPMYERVIAVDRSPARLAQCAQRVASRGFRHVSLFSGSFDDVELLRRVDSAGGADLVFASRTLHHASRPKEAIASFARLLRKGGHLVVLDYQPHDDESLREVGDVWLGLSPETISEQMSAAGLEVVGTSEIPASFHREGPDAHLHWHAVVARKPSTPVTRI